MRAVNNDNEITVVDEGNDLVGSLSRSEALQKDANFRTVHILVYRSDKLILQKLSQKHLKSPQLLGSSAAGFVLKDESNMGAAKRIMQKELGIIQSMPLDLIGKFPMKNRNSLKFVTVYRTLVKRMPPSNHSEFSELVELSDASVRTLLAKNPEKFTQTFVQVYSQVNTRH